MSMRIPFAFEIFEKEKLQERGFDELFRKF
jgi:hypothetical protein